MRTDGQTDRQTDGQTDKQTDRQTDKHPQSCSENMPFGKPLRKVASRQKYILPCDNFLLGIQYFSRKLQVRIAKKIFDTKII